MTQILSISSRVVRGTVGNSLAAFVLQRMGHAVWDVPTVVWDHHPGFGRPTGLTLTGDQLTSLLDDLREPPRAVATTHVVTGYFASRDQIASVRQHLIGLEAAGSDPFYCCDPVCGDAPGLYVRDDVRDALRSDLVPLASALTPNRHELGFLTGMPVSTNRAIVAAARALGRPLCLVTSAFASREDAIGNLIVTPAEVWACETPRFETAPNGTGDLMTALFAGWIAGGKEPVEAMARATAGLHAVLERTRAAGGPELALIDAQNALTCPKLTLPMRRLDTIG